MKKIVVFMVLGLVGIHSLSFAASFSFQGFSDISSDYIFGGMSSKGELLMSNSSGSYLWTHSGGLSHISVNNLNRIGTIATYSSETISDGANYVVGKNTLTNTTVLWTPQNGSENLHELMGIDKPNSLRAESVSANGIVVGKISKENDPGQWYSQAFSYDSQTGVTTILGTSFMPTGAYGVSRDGTMVTGSYEEQPFYWTQSQGIQLVEHADIPFLQIQDYHVSEIFDISDDGQTMVGWSGNPFECVATVWNPNGDIIVLADEENNSFATSVSGDGTIVVGHEFMNDVPNQRIAFIWDEINGKRFLNDMLISAGVDLGGWHLGEALAISSDGDTIMGAGINPDGQFEYWVATIPEPATVLLLGLGGLLVRNRK